MWRKYLLRHEPAFFCPSLIKSEPTRMSCEVLRSEAKKCTCCININRTSIRSLPGYLDFRKQVHEETSPYPLLEVQDQRLQDTEQNQLPCGSTGTPSGNCQETETCMVRACHTHDSLSKTILQGTLEGGRRRGRQRKCWLDNVKEWISLPIPELLTRASCRNDWKRISAESSIMSPRRPNLYFQPASVSDLGLH